MRYNIFLVLILWVFLLGTETITAQDSLAMLKYNPEEIINLSVQNSSGIEIISASKQAESLFEAPLTSTVITREDMIRAGVTSIPEAMRLVPGVIVRQISNGNYDIHLRGLDFILPYTITTNSLAKSILVMIDGRSVYNHLNGGTFWETLPIDMQDVQQIEVVKGPVASLYGPNAVSGVINIITQRPQENRLRVRANTQYGRFNTFITNSSVAYRVNSHFDVTLSGYFHERGRTSEEYFNLETRSYAHREDITLLGNPVADISDFYPEPDIAQRRYGFNTFMSYHPNANVSLRLSAGIENSSGQKIFLNLNPSPLQYATSQSQYIDLDMNIYGLRGKISYVNGEEQQKVEDLSPYNYDVLDALVEYEIPIVENLQITPSVFARRVTYREKGEAAGFFINDGEDNVLNNYAAGVQVNYKPWEKIRLISAVRAERFNIPDDLYLSYQAVFNYQPNSRQHFRLIYGKSNGGAYIFSAYLDLNIDSPLNTIPGFTSANFNVRGNENLRLLSQEAFELGYRSKITDWLELDLALFRSLTQDFDGFITTRVNFLQPPTLNTEIRVLNTETTAEQIGGTLNLNFTRNKLEFRPFITIQHTRLNNFSPYLVSPLVDPDFNLTTTSNIKHRTTPDFYGGFVINYRPNQQLNFNINTYYFGEHNLFTDEEATLFAEGTEGAEVKARMIVNARVGYNFYRRFTIFGTVRDLFSNNFEHYFTDKVRASYFFGFNLEW